MGPIRRYWLAGLLVLGAIGLVLLGLSVPRETTASAYFSDPATGDTYDPAFFDCTEGVGNHANAILLSLASEVDGEPPPSGEELPSVDEMVDELITSVELSDEEKTLAANIFYADADSQVGSGGFLAYYDADRMNAFTHQVIDGCARIRAAQDTGAVVTPSPEAGGAVNPKNVVGNWTTETAQLYLAPDRTWSYWSSPDFSQGGEWTESESGLVLVIKGTSSNGDTLGWVSGVEDSADNTLQFTSNDSVAVSDEFIRSAADGEEDEDAGTRQQDGADGVERSAQEVADALESADRSRAEALMFNSKDLTKQAWAMLSGETWIVIGCSDDTDGFSECSYERTAPDQYPTDFQVRFRATSGTCCQVDSFLLPGE